MYLVISCGDVMSHDYCFHFNKCNIFTFNTRAGSPGLSKGLRLVRVGGGRVADPLGGVGRARAYPCDRKVRHARRPVTAEVRHLYF